MLYSTDKFEKGFINKKGIDNLRHLFGTEIFSDDLDNYYKEQTEYRNLLNADAQDEISALTEKIKNGLADNSEFVLKFVALAKRMQRVSGKKVYGYLPKSVKAMINELVDMLEKDKDIECIYDLWYQAKCAVYSTYTDNPPPKKPLSQEEAFKPIRNSMIKDSDVLGKLLYFVDNKYDEPIEKITEENDRDNTYKKNNKITAYNNTGLNPQNTSTSSNKSKSSHTSLRNGYISASVIRFGNSLSQIFRERFEKYANHALIDVDSRLKQEIEAKKKGLNISM